jgi:hypothetical protein
MPQAQKLLAKKAAVAGKRRDAIAADAAAKLAALEQKFTKSRARSDQMPDLAMVLKASGCTYWGPQSSVAGLTEDPYRQHTLPQWMLSERARGHECKRKRAHQLEAEAAGAFRTETVTSCRRAAPFHLRSALKPPDRARARRLSIGPQAYL